MKLVLYVCLFLFCVAAVGCGSHSTEPSNAPVDSSKWVYDKVTGEMVPKEVGP